MTENLSDDVKALKDEVDERNHDMPAETALGNRDPQTTGKGDPKDYEGDKN